MTDPLTSTALKIPARSALGTVHRSRSSLSGHQSACIKSDVWLNPPFGTKSAAWLRKMKAHGNGIALIPARTETEMFYESVWGGGNAVCFLKGRPYFYRVDGTRAAFNSGAPICLVAYGLANVEALERAALGVVVRWANTQGHGRLPVAET